ncbi:unnamed protein product [Schistosoma margrebowiei]|uniref:ATP-dependent DNA helicase n=1 Tax=Schistosoma margrebowiei TaxID=48269 RepID=A0AA85AG47_9TREM|nr:unnamed protein product [Schistosoma margrebowiei]
MDSSSSKTQEIQETLKILKTNINSITKQIDELNHQRENLQVQYDQLRSQLTTARVQEISSSLGTSSEYNSESLFPWTSEVNRVRKEIFRISEFRPLQITAINAVLDGRDVILVMPTGAGKSLVYQLPALLNVNAFKVNGRHRGSLTLVISPLVSLMVDQSINLTRYSLEPDTIAVLDANTPLQEQRRILSLLAEKSNKTNISTKSNLRLLYVTPEKLAKSKLLLNRLEIAYSMNRLACIAIDEVHCASQWGHDFRPDYKFLHVLKRQFSNVPIIGLTATATTEIIVDIENMLGLNVDKCLVLRTSYNRENLNYYVKPVSGSIKASVGYLYELINKNYTNQSGIVYCFSQKDTEDVSSELKNFGLKVAPYHANLDFNYRSRVHSDWSQGRIQVIVATVAFGMGIDKADVRFVIHFSSSKSLENYYQESGRAGRDSNSADCILMWRFSDLFRLASMVSSERTGIAKLYEMVRYCIDPDMCRRFLISKNLGDASWSTDDCKNACDNCQRKNTNKSDVSTLIQIKTDKLLNATKQLLFDQSLTKQERITGPKLIDLMTCNKQIQSISQKLLYRNQEKPERQFYEYFISWCLIKQYLKLDFHFTPYSTVCYVVNNDNSVDNEHIELMPYLLSIKEELDKDKVTEERSHVDAKRKRIHSTEMVDLT